jgi:chemotaxis protein CheX
MFMLFDKLNDDSLLRYVVNYDFTEKIAELIVVDIRREILSPPKWSMLVFDFQSFDVDFKAFKVLSSLGLELRKLNIRMFAMTDKKSVHSFLKQEGLDKLLKPISSLTELGMKAPAKKVSKKLDVNFINPFIEGTLHVLNVQCGSVVTPQKLELKSKFKSEKPIEIAGIIGINSLSFKGVISLCFPAVVFLELMSKMLGEDYHEINDELKDGAGELTNMIFGHAKKVLNEKGHTFEKALPTIAYGKDLNVETKSSGESVILPFLVSGNIFYMEIQLEDH